MRYHKITLQNRNKRNVYSSVLLVKKILVQKDNFVSSKGLTENSPLHIHIQWSYTQNVKSFTQDYEAACKKFFRCFQKK